MKNLVFIILITCFANTLALAQSDTMRTFIFGHSLLDHRPPAIPTPSDETTVPHWVFKIAQAANHPYAAGGKYGFLPSHARDYPFSQWGYDMVPGVWDSEVDSFSTTDMTNIIITAGNFIQGTPPNHMYYGADSIYTPISATIEVFDWCNSQLDSLNYYIYENWPEMSDTILPYPPSHAELAPYYAYTQNGFHDWWLEYQDSLLDQRPDLHTRMIPVGPILSKLLTTTILSEIPITALYEDMAPHGRPTLYFLASLVTYMALYEAPAPLNLSLDTIIHDTVVNNYEQVVNFIWNELISFNDNNGNSRVFFDNLSAVDVVLDSTTITLYPNPTTGFFTIDGMTSEFDINVLDVNGIPHQNYNASGQITIDISTLPTGLYFIRIQKQGSSDFYLEKILKE